MSHGDPYREGYLAACTGKSRLTPKNLSKEQRIQWLKGFDKAWGSNPEERKRPGRPSMTR